MTAPFDVRPVRLSDIARLRDSAGLLSADMGWLLGVSPGRWGRMMRDARSQPERYSAPHHALLLRWMVAHPDLATPLRGPEPGPLLRRLRAAVDGRLTARWFGLALGCDATAGHRWLRLGAAIGPAGRRALALIDDPDPARLVANWNEWSTNARHEARLRGIPDLTKALGWRPGRAPADPAS